MFSQIIGAKELSEDNFAQDRANYMAKIEVMPLLKNQPETVYVEERNLDKDLNIVEIAKYFNCKTLAGAHFLESVLRLPISPKSNCLTLAERQQIIMQLVNNSELKAQIDALLAEAKMTEQTVVNLLSGEFRGASCPEEKTLEILKATKNPQYGLCKFLFTNSTGKTLQTGINFFGLIGAGYATSSLAKLNYQLYSQGQTNSRLVLYNAYMGVLAGFSAYAIGKDYLNAFKKRNKMHALNKIIVIAEQFEALSAQYNLPVKFKMSDVLDQGALTLIKELKKARYSQEVSYLFNTAKVHSFLYDIYENDGCLVDFFACISEMDAYNAIATKMLELQSRSNQFCFAEYITAERAQIKATGFWNVLVNADSVVTNDLSEDKNIIFSGVNGGGKTSSTRAILQNIVLAQTFGIAAAREFIFTPFDIVHAYLNVSDDLIAGESLFVSEVKRAQEVKEKINSITGTNLKFFFALDELFTGTSDKAGQDCACNFLANIVQSPNIMFIYPTHFDKLKELGETNEYCVNYKVDTAIKNEDGKLVYPFTISRGASYDNIAIDIAANANLFN